MISLRGLHRSIRPYVEEVIRTAEGEGVRVRVTSTFRSLRQQATLYRRFLAGRSRWPANPPGQSAHNYGFAFDAVASNQRRLVRIAQEVGFYVPPNDPIHFEMPGWRDVVRLRRARGR